MYQKCYHFTYDTKKFCKYVYQSIEIYVHQLGFIYLDTTNLNVT